MAPSEGILFPFYALMRPVITGVKNPRFAANRTRNNK